MENKKSIKSLFSIDVCGLKLRVFTAGSEPRLSAQKSSPTDPKVMRGLHSHFTYEIFFVTKGRLELVTAENTDSFERKAIIIPPRLGHYSYPSENGSYCLLFELCDSGSERATEVMRRLDTGVFDTALTDDMIFYIEKACEKLDKKTTASEKEAELLISLLFCEVLSTVLPVIDIESGSVREAKHISDIERYINSHIGERITVSDVARSVYLSTRQISRIVKGEYGCSFTELVTGKRLAAAEMLVKNSDISMAGIAAQVGFGAEGYFYTLFRGRYGMTPLQYRIAHKKDVYNNKKNIKI